MVANALSRRMEGVLNYMVSVSTVNLMMIVNLGLIIKQLSCC